MPEGAFINRYIVLVSIALVFAGCEFTSSKISTSTYTAPPSTTKTLVEQSMDLDTLLIERAEAEGLPMTDKQLARLKKEFSEDELRNGGFTSVIGGYDLGPCYCRGFDEDGRYQTPCLCIWTGSTSDGAAKTR